jgi:hypothetical protein
VSLRERRSRRRRLAGLLLRSVFLPPREQPWFAAIAVVIAVLGAHPMTLFLFGFEFE